MCASPLSTRACLLTVARGSAHFCFSNHRSYILLHQRSPHKIKAQKKNFSHLSIKSNPDLQPIWTIKTCQSSIHDFRSSSILTAISHRYIHLKGILVPVFVDKNPHYGFLDISVDFIKPEERPTSDLELVFKDGAGDKQQSKKFKKKDFIYWSLDMSVHVVSIIVLRY